MSTPVTLSISVLTRFLARFASQDARPERLKPFAPAFIRQTDSFKPFSDSDASDFASDGSQLLKNMFAPDGTWALTVNDLHSETGNCRVFYHPRTFSIGVTHKIPDTQVISASYETSLAFFPTTE